MRAKRFKNIDYGFRPESYRLAATPLQAILADSPLAFSLRILPEYRNR